MKSKKSSLSLSVNAIVVLIIAITMLGLGLGFVKMLFGGAVEKFEGVLAEEADPESSSPSNPITLSRSAVIAKPGKDQAIKISLYNPTNTSWTNIQPDISCTDFTGFDEAVNPKNVPQGSSVIFGALLKIPSAAQQGTYLCQITFTEAGGATIPSADFTIQVQYK